MLEMAIIPPLLNPEEELTGPYAVYLDPDEGLLYRIEQFIAPDGNFTAIGNRLGHIVSLLGRAVMVKATTDQSIRDALRPARMLEAARLCAELSADINTTNAQIEYCRAVLRWAYRDGWEPSDDRIAFAEKYIADHEGRWWQSDIPPVETAFVLARAGA